jgi:hypothetical protein
MKMPSVVLFVALASTFFLKSGHAEVSVADVALLTVVQGEVSFQGKDGKARPVVAYMRIRHGDTIRLQKRSIMRLGPEAGNLDRARILRRYVGRRRGD